MTFDGKVIVVTGSSSGIGRATALRLAQEGAAVVVNSRTNVTGGEELVRAIRALGREAIYVQADLAEPAQVSLLFERTLQTFGTVDILVNNAGHTVVQPFLQTTKDHWLEMLGDNLLSAVLCAREAAVIMLEKGGGKIINVSSIRGIDYAGVKAAMAYSSAKAALSSFTRTLAKELGPAITVNAIAPGFVYTPRYDRISQEVKQAMVSATTIKRFIEVGEIADAVLFVAGAGAMTGQVLVIDGGFSLKTS